MSLILSILITSSLYLFHLARAGPYAGSVVQALIPFAEADSMTTPFTSRYHVPIQLSTGPPGTRINTQVYRPFVDTGTTGIVLPAARIPGFTVPTDPGAERGWQYLTSSKILYGGWWIEKDVYFNVNNHDNPPVKSTLKILAVTERTEGCNDLQINGEIYTCPGKSPTPPPMGLGILGIGFGRRGADQPQAFAHRNPALTVSTIGGRAATWPTFHRGYQIDRRGITLGLTDSNMVPFTIGGQPYAQLRVKLNLGSRFTDWQSLRSCVSINSSPCVPMPALLDTGVTQSYLHMPRNYMGWNFNSLPKSPVAPGSTDNKLDAGHVRIDFWPPEGHKNEDFSVGDAATIASGVTPDIVVFYVNNDPNSFRVNTGMHVYRKYKVAFDSVWGRFWLAAADCPRSGCPPCVPVHPCPGNLACTDPRPHKPEGEDEEDPPCCNAAAANAECERQREECRWAGCF
ncbi:outer membrane autotransporter barrel protein [Metarhizium guizhouense ARSEF 977]|uniref:Outer membrane autotransporter barrel protein n=1 Tax=Metarhizium guizhouense (strain ARSEF 977) TaxID=1276136 RepID=A0A0B4G3Y9_METGA|nr:outer membrane autotransporter barrel protein [Metarhizium guizhouense ARSEF 977]